MEERSLELKVGLLALLALAATLAFWILFQGPVGRGALVAVDFADSGGLTAGAPVKLAGVPVGRVSALDLLPLRRDNAGRPLPVRVRLRLEPDLRAALRADARFAITTQGPLGEPFIELTTGTPGLPPLADGSALRGDDPPRFDRIFADVERLLGRVSDAVERDPHSVEALIHHLDSFVSDADETLRTLRPSLLSTATEVAGAATDARELAREARPLLGQLDAQLPDILRRVSVLSSRADALSAGLTAADLKQLRITAEAAEASFARVQALTARADRILDGVERGHGTVGGVIKDPKLYEDLKDLVADLKAHPWKVLWKK